MTSSRDAAEFFDATRVHPGCRGFSGVVGDGNRLYFAPLNNGDFHGQVLCFDTDRSFSDPASWSVFDLARVAPGCRGFVDAVFDGRFVNFIPFFDGAAHHGRLTRYDTRAAFDDPTAWSHFDSTLLEARSRGFVSGCFDGRYLYLSPYQLDHTTTHGQVTRFDTRAALDDPAAWSFFDLTSVHAGARGYHSAVSDGERFIWLVPYFRDPGEYNGIVARFDSRGRFDDPDAWQCVDLTRWQPGWTGFVGGVLHDGYLHLIPYHDGTDRHGRVVRCRTKASLADPTAWSAFDCARVDPGSRGFFGGLCDSTHLYLVPHCRGPGQYHGLLTRWRVDAPFDSPSSWSTCDLAALDPDARGFMGAALHDRHLYLAPFETDAGRRCGLIARVDTASTDSWSTR